MGIVFPSGKNSRAGGSREKRPGFARTPLSLAPSPDEGRRCGAGVRAQGKWGPEARRGWGIGAPAEDTA